MLDGEEGSGIVDRGYLAGISGDTSGSEESETMELCLDFHLGIACYHESSGIFIISPLLQSSDILKYI